MKNTFIISEVEGSLKVTLPTMLKDVITFNIVNNTSKPLIIEGDGKEILI